MCLFVTNAVKNFRILLTMIVCIVPFVTNGKKKSAVIQIVIFVRIDLKSLISKRDSVAIFRERFLWLHCQ
jgi:hypothetical protein